MGGWRSLPEISGDVDDDVNCPGWLIRVDGDVAVGSDRDYGVVRSCLSGAVVNRRRERCVTGAGENPKIASSCWLRYRHVKGDRLGIYRHSALARENEGAVRKGRKRRSSVGTVRLSSVYRSAGRQRV